MSDKENKSRLGFRTGATELQDRFEKLFNEVENKEKAWDEFIKFVNSTNEEVNANITTESSNKNLGLINFRECLTTLAVIGLLGKILANIEVRVVDLEKSIERLHLKVK